MIIIYVYLNCTNIFSLFALLEIKFKIQANYELSLCMD